LLPTWRERRARIESSTKPGQPVSAAAAAARSPPELLTDTKLSVGLSQASKSSGDSPPHALAPLLLEAESRAGEYRILAAGCALC
jgi:hypothetical protein